MVSEEADDRQRKKKRSQGVPDSTMLMFEGSRTETRKCVLVVVAGAGAATKEKKLPSKSES